MKLRTEIKISASTTPIYYKDSVFALGSCFSGHISSQLKRLCYSVFSDPCGITFNPASLLSSIKRVCAPDSLHENELFYQNGHYVHLDFHSSFDHPSKEHYLKYSKNVLHAASDALKKTKVVLVTIGTCFVYRHINTNTIANNCHKLPSEDFTRSLMSLSDVLTTLQELRSTIRAYNEEGPQIIFTVSPVRHTRNGLVDDRKSKSIALLAVHDICDQYADCHYFPAYEIMIDDLRDYRFYNADLIHPRQVAVDHIFDSFSKSWLVEEEGTLRSDISALRLRLDHKPRFPDSTAHRIFLDKLNRDKHALIAKHPFLEENLL